MGEKGSVIGKDISGAQSEIILTKDQTKRNSAVECLRILAMLAIVLSHACVHSGFDLSLPQISFNRLIVQWGVLGNLGVDIYMIISGYFLCTKGAQAKTLSKLFVQLWFYSVVLFLVCRFGFGHAYSLRDYLNVFLPTLFAEYWFFTAYVVLAILSPYINILIREATQKQLQGALLCMIFMWIIVPTFTKQQLYGTEIPQFVMLYTIGAYFRKYPDNCLQYKTFRSIVTIGSFVLLFLSTVVLDCLGMKFSVFQNRGTLFYERNSLLIVSCAAGLFAIAVYQKPFFNAFINNISGCTFGVYLIHDNPVIRQILWKQLLHLADFFDSPVLIAMILGSVIAVFVGSTLIELLRQKTVAKPMTQALNKCNEKMMQLIKSMWDRIKLKITNKQ